MDAQLYPIRSRDWWFKVVGMLNENWALIEQEDQKITVYFFHSCGVTMSSVGPRNGSWAAIVDCLVFADECEAQKALMRNGFCPFSEVAESWEGNPPPEGQFYDAREKESGIYSKQGYWKG